MFPILKEIDRAEKEEPLFVDYVITSKGWRASGTIKCRGERDKRFWGNLEMVVSNILRGEHDTTLNESYTDGFSRYLRPVKQNDFTKRWEEMDYQSLQGRVNKDV